MRREEWLPSVGIGVNSGYVHCKERSDPVHVGGSVFLIDADVFSPGRQPYPVCRVVGNLGIASLSLQVT